MHEGSSPHFREPAVQMWHQMAMFIKSHMNIRRLSLNIGGVAPGDSHYVGKGNYDLWTSKHPEIDELLVLPPVERLAIRWATFGVPGHVCVRHGAWCFDTTNLFVGSRCSVAYQSMAIASLIKSIREHLLASGQQLGLSRIRGGLVFHQVNQQDESIYIVMETDDSCSGTSNPITQQVSHLTNSNTGSHTITSPRWPGRIDCMESVSDDFHQSLKHSQYLVRPAKKEVTFHFVWIDCLTADAATRALDCEDYWGNKIVRRELRLNIEAPPFTTNTVKKGHEADPRNFNNYWDWRDRLRHLLQFSRWALDFVEIFFLPRTVDQSELDLSLFRTPDHQQHYLGGPSRLLAVPDTNYPDLRRAVAYGEADQ